MEISSSLGLLEKLSRRDVSITNGEMCEEGIEWVGEGEGESEGSERVLRGRHLAHMDRP